MRGIGFKEGAHMWEETIGFKEGAHMWEETKQEGGASKIGKIGIFGI